MNKILFLICLLSIVSEGRIQFIRFKEFIADTEKVKIVSFSPDGSYFATGGKDGTVKIWYSEKFDKTIVLDGHKNGINALAFSPDGKYLASAGNDNKIKLWQTTDWKEMKTFESEGVVRAIIFSLDTFHLIAGNEKGELEIWNIFSKKREILRINKVGINSLFQDKRFLIVGGSDRVVTILEPVTLGEVTKLKGFKDFISHTAISPNDKTLAISINRRIELWNLDNYSKIKALNLRGAMISMIKFSPDGKYLFATTDPCFGGAGYIKVWKIDNWQMLHSEKISCGISSFDFFFPKSLLVVANGKNLTVFTIKL